jgi:cephalosporin hydroxylase
MPPEPVPVSLDEPLHLYWTRRILQHASDSYCGVPLTKFPEDLRVFEHLLWESRSNVVVELGADAGGSALWFRDRLLTLARHDRIANPLVISIDLDTSSAREHLDRVGGREWITLLDGDVLDPDLPARVEAALPPDSRCLVAEDTAHVYETTVAALEHFAGFVPRGGFFVVEDGCVDVEALRPADYWPRGVHAGIAAWLQTPAGEAFEVRRELELYGVTSNVSGFLRRVR